MKELRQLSRTILLVALLDGTGGLLTLYWAKFIPFECYNFTCQTPPFWLELAMLASFGLGMIVPAIGIVSTISKHYASSRKGERISFANSSVAESLNHPKNKLENQNLIIVFEVVAFLFLLATGISLFLLHVAYMGFYDNCYLPGFVPAGFDCSSVFADPFFVKWSIVSVLSSVGIAVFWKLSGRLLVRNKEPRDLRIEKLHRKNRFRSLLH